MLNLILIGAGQRGTIYADYAYRNHKAKIKAVVEPHSERREIAQNRYQIKPDDTFSDFQSLLKKGKIADAVILASMDKDHYKQAMSLLDLGYDLLLEKPISPNPSECIAIRDKANALGRKVIVCHVLRYTSFFSTIKSILDSHQLGKVISIQHNENIGNFHMAHSFVRGNWRKASETSPLILQKSCHDMDILAWLANSEAAAISSFGDLRYFKEENAPSNSTDRCLHCPAAPTCRFDARKMYLPVRGDWPATVVCSDQSKEGLLEALETGPYGRCVYRCDNDVCDNQVSLIQFKNGVTVSFNLSAFTDKMSRTLKIMCENGEIRGDDSLNRIEVIPFSSNQSDSHIIQVITPKVVPGFHGGGDTGLMQNFFEIMDSKTDINESISSIDRSVESHIMSYAAELSRLNGKTILLDDLKSSLAKQEKR